MTFSDDESPDLKNVGTRRLARIMAMQMLCQFDVQGDEAMRDFETLCVESEAPPQARTYARELMDQAWRQRADGDRRIAAAATDWRPERISPVERNILRIAVQEMLAGEVPLKVAIDEAIEISRVYGGADSPGFINGVLDGIYRHMREETGDGIV